MTSPTGICPVCNGPVPADSGRIYCSDECRLKAKRHRDLYPALDGAGGAKQTFGERECPICHDTFTAQSMSQVYCSVRCRRKALRTLSDERRAEIRASAFARRSFTCPVCKEHVKVTEPGDNRTRFCSHACEREFWRHRALYEKGGAAS